MYVGDSDTFFTVCNLTQSCTDDFMLVTHRQAEITTVCLDPHVMKSMQSAWCPNVDH